MDVNDIFSTKKRKNRPKKRKFRGNQFTGSLKPPCVDNAQDSKKTVFEAEVASGYMDETVKIPIRQEEKTVRIPLEQDLTVDGVKRLITLPPGCDHQDYHLVVVTSKDVTTMESDKQITDYFAMLEAGYMMLLKKKQ